MHWPPHPAKPPARILLQRGIPMISELVKKIKEKNAPVVVGLDPNMKFIPEAIVRDAAREHRELLFADDELVIAAESVWRFNKEIIDAVQDLVPAVKPQIAMYEQFGTPGLVTYWRTVNYAHEKGLLVIGDIKRGDIGSTSEAYARAHIGKVKVNGHDLRVFDEDFATVNPYMGVDSVKPFIDVCNENNRGIFVLVKTSNPSSADFQDVRMQDGRPLYELVGEKVREWGESSMDGEYSNVGAVIGATYPEQAKDLRALMPHTFILAPGYGAQGATAKDLSGFFNSDGTGAIVNSSRGIIAAYTKERYSRYGAEGFADAARAAAIDMIEDLRSVL